MTVPPCPACGRQFEMFRHLTKHLRAQHPDVDSIACSYCEGFHATYEQLGRCKSKSKKERRGVSTS